MFKSFIPMRRARVVMSNENMIPNGVTWKSDILENGKSGSIIQEDKTKRVITNRYFPIGIDCTNFYIKNIIGT